MKILAMIITASALLTGCLWTIRSSDGKMIRTGLAKKSRPHFTITLHTDESATSNGNCIWVRTDT
jgi:hypothetical protein